MVWSVDPNSATFPGPVAPGMAKFGPCWPTPRCLFGDPAVATGRYPVLVPSES